jgi:hypothetical protein
MTTRPDPNTPETPQEATDGHQKLRERAGGAREGRTPLRRPQGCSADPGWVAARQAAPGAPRA